MAEKVGSIIWRIKQLKSGDSLILFKIKSESVSGMLSRSFMAGGFEVNKVLIIDSAWRTQKAIRVTKKRSRKG
jgi:hypothetical protein